MPDKINEKIVNIFARHKKQLPCSCDDEKVIRNDEGYYYVCIKKDENGHNFDKERIIDRINTYNYIVKVMDTESEHPHIYSYKVPGNKIIEFLLPYANQEKNGTVIEIEKYHPIEPA